MISYILVYVLIPLTPFSAKAKKGAIYLYNN